MSEKEIVERLRERAKTREHQGDIVLFAKAADHIETLQTRVKKLKGALTEINASGLCYCVFAPDKKRQGVKCPICVSEAALRERG